jgi:glyoxylase-like metal-dependent hydrolase (beta-lactamase superfamily II)
VSGAGICHGSIVRIKVPVPFPLRYVNSYLIAGDNGCTLLDPGLHTEDTEAFWETTLKERGLSFADIEKIVLTHHHPDHYGIAGWFQERSRAKVLMSQKGYELAQAFWGERRTMTQKTCELFLLHGMDRDTAQQMFSHMEQQVFQVLPHPQVEFLQSNEFVRLGQNEYRVVEVSGHAQGHLCFYQEENREIFCGDHVISTITPNISYIPGGESNPLQSFLDGLHLLQQLEVSIAFSGHRDPIEHFSRRIDEMIEHHRVRLERMAAELKTPMTAYELCLRTFGKRLTIHQLRFAMSETLAHVMYLAAQNKVQPIDHGSVMMYQTRD